MTTPPIAPPMRTFIAIELPATVIDLLTRIQRDLGASGLPLRYSAAGGMHLTLGFIGEIPAATVPTLIAAVQTGAAGIAPFDLRAEGLGMFPNARAPRVVWAGVEGAPAAMTALTALHSGIVAAITSGGLALDRRFDPHLTLARVRDDAPPTARAQVGAAVQSLPTYAAAPFHVDTVSVMHSDLRPSGAVYMRLAAVRLVALPS